MNIKRSILGLFAVLLLFGCQQGAERRTESDASSESSIMLLGVYHFNNPGRDTYNVEIDNYFSDKRQQELEELVSLLEEYNPTKIFVEFTPDRQSQIDSLYQLYLDDKIKLDEIQNGVNEVYQIGFRLGKKSGGIQIKAIDHSGPWLGAYVDFIADTLALDYYQKKLDEEQTRTKEKQRRFSSNTVRENLLYLNEEEQIIENHDYYNNVAINVKDTAKIMFTYQETEQEIDGLPYQMRSYDFNNIGVEMVAEWYKRNLFIYRNIIEDMESNDRVIVIIGSGHVFYLNQLLSNNPKFELINPNEILTKTNK
ncbi:MAG: DUF5694 domain-containing protein [Reichenbachiella sp.]|uniref:DUF5694 domain-containing protein n=1 Tax=Reichenbachiella sp. TaxID=2184521 RepID=UPI0032647FA1